MCTNLNYPFEWMHASILQVKVIISISKERIDSASESNNFHFIKCYRDEQGIMHQLIYFHHPQKPPIRFE